LVINKKRVIEKLLSFSKKGINMFKKIVLISGTAISGVMTANFTETALAKAKQTAHEMKETAQKVVDKVDEKAKEGVKKVGGKVGEMYGKYKGEKEGVKKYEEAKESVKETSSKIAEKVGLKESSQEEDSQQQDSSSTATQVEKEFVGFLNKLSELTPTTFMMELAKPGSELYKQIGRFAEEGMEIAKGIKPEEIITHLANYPKVIQLLEEVKMAAEKGPENVKFLAKISPEWIQKIEDALKVIEDKARAQQTKDVSPEQQKNLQIIAETFKVIKKCAEQLKHQAEKNQ
jgi:hypothetical protein